MPRLTLLREHLDCIQAHALAEAPAEACGVLVGRRKGEDLSVERVMVTKNVHPTPDIAYLIEPGELLRILMLAEDDRGLEVVGFYHSHPVGPARMSATDIARASWPDAVYLLVWLAPMPGVACFTWRENEHSFEPREVVVRADQP